MKYLLDIFMPQPNEQHTVNYMQLFMMLDSHSSFHIMHQIKHPVLIITGFLDMLTPAYHSFEMARRYTDD